MARHASICASGCGTISAATHGGTSGTKKATKYIVPAYGSAIFPNGIEYMLQTVVHRNNANLN